LRAGALFGFELRLGASEPASAFVALELQGRLDGADRGEPGECQSGGVDVRQPVGLLRDDRGLDRSP
jgi:hypothetical protein